MTHSRTYLLIRKATISALIAALLALPLAGVQLEDLSGKNSLEYRPLWVLAAAGCVFVGSVLMEVWKSRKLVRSTRTSSLFPKLSPAHQSLALATLAMICGFFPMTPVANRYAIDLATTFLIYVMLGWGLNIVVGLAGLLDLGYVAFYAVGAYTFGILSLHFGVGFWLALPACGLAAAAMGLLLGFPVLRLKGDYLAIVTLGFGEIIRIVLINWASVTGGPNGISGVPRPSFFGLPFSPLSSDGSPTFASFFGLAYSPLHRIAWLYYIVFFLAAGTFAVTQRLRRLPVGRAWEALREDETACQALGLNPTIIKLSAFSLGAMLGGIAGCFFAARQGFISPESFTFGESAIILAIVVLGGMGNQLGVVVAAALLVGLPELGRDFAQFRMLFFGIAMVFIMVWRPQGLIAGRKATVMASQDQVSVISMEQAQ